MTLSLFLWTAGAAFLFALGSIFTYHLGLLRGKEDGYNSGLKVGLRATVKQLKDKHYEIEVKHDE